MRTKKEKCDHFSYITIYPRDGKKILNNAFEFLHDFHQRLLRRHSEGEVSLWNLPFPARSLDIFAGHFKFSRRFSSDSLTVFNFSRLFFPPSWFSYVFPTPIRTSEPLGSFLRCTRARNVRCEKKRRKKKKHSPVCLYMELTLCTCLVITSIQASSVPYRAKNWWSACK